MTYIKAQAFIGGEYGVKIAGIPDQCPRCHHHVHPLLRHAHIMSAIPTTGKLTAHVIFQCPRQRCLELFIARYQNDNSGRKKITHLDISSHALTLRATEPRTPQPGTFPSEIAELSPQFVAVYNQASAAEDLGLEDIAGPGFGKALEFLVKDYLVHESPNDAMSIKQEFLGAVIKNRVSDSRIKQCAERAAWLRNDETHYERRWNTKDREDLKSLITLTVNWVHSTLLTAAFVREMPTARSRARAA